MSIGQYLGSGFMDMWFISPIFKGKPLFVIILSLASLGYCIERERKRVAIEWLHLKDIKLTIENDNLLTYYWIEKRNRETSLLSVFIYCSFVNTI